jgi:hypothetical protein
MEIVINGPDAQRLGAEACKSLFGEDADKGPVRLSPPILEQIKNDWPAGPKDVLDIGLEPPPGAPINGFKITLHRVAIIVGGRRIGYGLRLSDLSLMGLRAYERAWATYRASQR